MFDQVRSIPNAVVGEYGVGARDFPRRSFPRPEEGGGVVGDGLAESGHASDLDDIFHAGEVTDANRGGVARLDEGFSGFDGFEVFAIGVGW